MVEAMIADIRVAPFVLVDELFALSALVLVDPIDVRVALLLPCHLLPEDSGFSLLLDPLGPRIDLFDGESVLWLHNYFDCHRFKVKIINLSRKLDYK